MAAGGIFSWGANFQILGMVQFNFASHTLKLFITQSYCLGDKSIPWVEVAEKQIYQVYFNQLSYLLLKLAERITVFLQYSPGHNNCYRNK